MKKPFFYLVLSFFFLSGACGLVYEVAWSRDFVLVVGGTTKAVTAVVAVFMGGLGLGGLLGGRLVDRARTNPIVIYGILEGLIGALALLVPLFVTASRPLLSAAYGALGGGHFGIDLVRFAVAALILLPPTLLMGATLPVLMKATLASRERYGLAAGRLFAVNTLGAMTGAGVAGFVLLPYLGNQAAVWIAAAVNISICVLVLVFGRRLPAYAPAEAAESKERPPWSRKAVLVVVGYGLSGLAALIYQIAWTRSLGLSLGGSTYSFTLILVSFIGGLGLGGALITPWVDRIKKPLFNAGLMEFVIGLSALLVLPALDNLSEHMHHWYFRYADSGMLLWLIRFGASFGVVFVPTLFMGALMPLLSRGLSLERPGAGEPVGWVYFSNTVGAVVGSFLAGYVLMHFFGVRFTILLATLVSLSVGAAWTVLGEAPRRSSFLVTLLAAAVSAVLLRGLPPPDPLLINSNPFVYASKTVPFLGRDESVREAMHRQYRVLYFREDSEVSAMVIESRVEKVRYLRINGKTDASSYLDMPTQSLLGHLPVLAHPDPKTVMILGLASGVTPGRVLMHPVERVDCLELSPAVVEASRYFHDISRLDFDDPRFNLIVNDGRNHLLLTDRTYDVILSEPSNPWQAGQGTLFTLEYFELMKSRLNEGGVALSWMDVYNMDADTLKLLLRTFVEVFPHVMLWETVPNADYLLIGSATPFEMSVPSLSERLSETPAAAKDLKAIGSHGLELLFRYMMGDGMIEKLAGKGELHTDDRRQLEFLTPRSVLAPFGERLPGLLEEVLYHHEPAYDSIEMPAGERGAALRSELERINSLRLSARRFDLKRLTGAAPPEEIIEEGMELIDRLAGRYPSRSLRIDLGHYINNLGRGLALKGEREAAMELYKRSYKTNPESGMAPLYIAHYHLVEDKLEEARLWAERSLAAAPGNHMARMVLAQAARREGDAAEEERQALLALQSWPEHAPYRIILGRALSDQSKFTEAVLVFEDVLAEHPENSDGHYFLGVALFNLGDFEESAKHLAAARRVDPEHPSREHIDALLEEARKRSRN